MKKQTFRRISQANFNKKLVAHTFWYWNNNLPKAKARKMIKETKTYYPEYKDIKPEKLVLEGYDLCKKEFCATLAIPTKDGWRRVRGTEIAGAAFLNCNMKGADLYHKGCNLLNDVDFTGTTFENAILGEYFAGFITDDIDTNPKSVNFMVDNGVRVYIKGKFIGANLTNCNFTGATTHGWDPLTEKDFIKAGVKYEGAFGLPWMK